LKHPVILRVFKEDTLVAVKQFDQDQIVFGRPGSEVDLFLDEDAVSPIHCLIEKRNEEYYLCDLGSQSGTILNQSSILDSKITSGDTIHIGVFKIEFFVGAPKPKSIPDATPDAVSMKFSPNLVSTQKNWGFPNEVKVAIEPTQQFNENTSVQNLNQHNESVSVSNTELITKSKEQSGHNPDFEPQKVIPKPTVLNSAKEPTSFVGIKKKVTFAKKSEITDLKTYLKPGSGMSVQVLLAWKDRILNIYNFDQSKPVVIIGPGNSDDIKLPGNLAGQKFAFIKRQGREVDVLIPNGASACLITNTNQLQYEEIKKLNRCLPAQGGQVFRIQNQEILQIKFGNSPLDVYVRRVPEATPIRPLGFIDISLGELTGLVVSLILSLLVALYMLVYAPVPSESLNTEEVRLAQFVYTKPPVKEIKPDVQEKEESIQTPPPPKIEPKKVRVTEEKNVQKPSLEQKNQTQITQRSGGQSSEIRPSPSKVVKPVKQTSVKRGGAVKMGDTEGANAASREKDVSQTGLLSAFGGGGTRSRLDKAYSGSGELLGAASQASGFTGQNKNRDGDDLGSKFKDDGAGGKGIATQGIANLGTKGRGSGNAGYGAIGDGNGKGRVTIDVPGTTAEFVGTIDREAVRRVIRSILTQIRACYEKQLRSNPTLSGKVVITFEIADQGRVTSSRPKSSTLSDPEVGRCVAARIQAQRFPEPPSGTIAVVDYPFVFDSQK